jgi:hypothetical protein
MAWFVACQMASSIALIHPRSATAHLDITRTLTLRIIHVFLVPFRPTPPTSTRRLVISVTTLISHSNRTSVDTVSMELHAFLVRTEKSLWAPAIVLLVELETSATGMETAAAAVPVAHIRTRMALQFAPVALREHSVGP